MKKIISFSLYGNKPNFQVGALVNVLEAKRLFPDWTCRFYTTDDDLICKQLEYLGAEIVRMDDWPEGGMFWRFLAVDDADICISRDTDSVVSERELGAINEWFNEDYQWHAMHDHHVHRGVSMMGGMWGYRHYDEYNRPENRAQESAYFFNFRKKSIRQHIEEWLAEDPKRTTEGREWDQLFLGEVIYAGKAQTNIMWHGGWLNNRGNQFPKHVPCRYTKFVGDYSFSAKGWEGFVNGDAKVSNLFHQSNINNKYDRSLERAIIACDSNPNYLSFWELCSAAWKKINVKPTLVLVEKLDENIEIDESLGDVIRLKLPDKGINSIFAAQCCRLLAPALYPNENVTIADIDIIPLSKKYFNDNIRVCDDDCFLELRHGVCPGAKQIPICWNIAKGSVWADIFNVVDVDLDNYNKFFVDVLSAWHPPNYDTGNSTWYTDQRMLFKYVNNWHSRNHKKYIKLKDADTNFDRLDHRVQRVKGMHHHLTDFCPRRPPSHNLDYRDRPDLDNIDSIKDVFKWYNIPWLYS